MSIGDVSMANDSMGSLIKDSIASLQKNTSDLKAQMADIRAGKYEDQNTALIQMQFALGQYNAMVEMTSNIPKNITDTAKSLAQKAG